MPYKYNFWAKLSGEDVRYMLRLRRAVIWAIIFSFFVGFLSGGLAHLLAMKLWL